MKLNYFRKESISIIPHYCSFGYRQGGRSMARTRGHSEFGHGMARHNYDTAWYGRIWSGIVLAMPRYQMWNPVIVAQVDWLYPIHIVHFDLSSCNDRLASMEWTFLLLERLRCRTTGCKWAVMEDMEWLLAEVAHTCLLFLWYFAFFDSPFLVPDGS